MAKKVYARLNWGNWIADCPVHGEGIAEGVKPGATQTMICSRCHQGIHASMPVRVQGHTIRIPDPAVRELARKEAEQAGQIYEVVFPENIREIMRIVRKRKIQHINWRPGMTIADLQRENKEHGVK